MASGEAAGAMSDSQGDSNSSDSSAEAAAGPIRVADLADIPLAVRAVRLRVQRAKDPQTQSPKRRCLKQQPSRDTETSAAEEDWFHATEHVEELNDFTKNGPTERKVHMVDLFSASGMAAHTFKSHGYSSKAIDIQLDKGHDITTRAVFFMILSVCLALVPGGLILAGPPCSLYIFLSSSMHQRSKARPLGDTCNAKVRLSNLIVSNMCQLMMQMLARSVKIVVEQPSNSVMFLHPEIKALQNWEPDSPIFKKCEWLLVSTWMGKFNHDMPKPTRLLSNMGSSRLLARQMSLNQWRRERAAGPAQTRQYTRLTPAGVAGGKDLHRSASYTPEFCLQVFIAWEKEFVSML